MFELITSFLKIGLGSISSLLLNTVTLKVVALVIGPVGIGLLSILRDTRQTVVSLATFNGQAALVQGAASHEKEDRHKYLGSVLSIYLMGGTLAAAFLILFAPWIAQQIIGENDPSTIWLVRALAVPVLLNVLLGFANGVLNTYRAVGWIAGVQIAGALALAIIAYPVALAVEAGKTFFFITMLIASPLVGLSVSLWIGWHKKWLKPVLQEVGVRHRKEAFSHFFSIAGVMVITGFTKSGALLALRAIVARETGLDGAGFFDASWSLSMKYVTLILASLQTYYLPTLSQLQDPDRRSSLIKRVFRLTTILMVPTIIGVAVLKPWIIQILYSEEFIESLSITRWMLIGDYFKVAGWVFAMPMLAYADMWAFFVTEVVWNLIFLVIASVSVRLFGSLQVVGVVFLIMYVFYLGCVLYYVVKCYRVSIDIQMVLSWSIGLVLIIGASVCTWTDRNIYVQDLIPWLGCALLYFTAWGGWEVRKRGSLDKFLTQIKV